MKVFLKNMMENFGMTESYNEDDFDDVFAHFDTNGDGIISKEEMFSFL